MLTPFVIVVIILMKIQISTTLTQDTWFDLDFRHGGGHHRFPHYNVWDKTGRSSMDRSLWELIQWLIFGG